LRVGAAAEVAAAGDGFADRFQTAALAAALESKQPALFNADRT